MSTTMLDTAPIEIESVKQFKNADETHLFAVLDACDEPRIPMKAYELGEKAACLYRGKAEWSQAAIAPYLISVKENEFNWIMENLFGTSWGYFLVTPTSVSLAALRTHLRRFLTVKGPLGDELYFRFYDPRIILDFLETTNTEELNQFFGPIETLYLEQQHGLISVKRSSIVRH